MANLTLKDVASVIGADNVMTIKAHQRAIKQHRLEISQIKELLDATRELIEAKLPKHVGKKDVRNINEDLQKMIIDINEDVRTIQTARERLVELKNKIRRSELVCKTIFLNAKEQLEKRKSCSNQTEVRKEIPTNFHEDWQTFLRRKTDEIKAKKAAEQKQYTEKTATKTQTNESKITQEPSNKDVERAALELLNLLNLINAFSTRPRSRRDELEDVFRVLRGF